MIIVDCDRSDFHLDADGCGCLNFLPRENLGRVQEIEMREEMLRKCILLDRNYDYNPYPQIRTSDDIECLMTASGGFHDAYIENCEMKGNELYVLFAGVWGCEIEMWFSGDIEYSIASRDPEYSDPCWYGSTMLIEHEFIYFVDEDDRKVEDINNQYCWFKARNVTYHIKPNPELRDEWKANFQFP